MLRLLLLLGLPVLVYAYWRYIAKATEEQRARRVQATVFAVVSLVVIAVALRRGSPAMVGLAVLGLGLWNLFMRHKARQVGGGADAEGPNGPPPPSGGGSGRPSQMTATQALEILGLEPGASRDQIQQRYRQLMQGVHPDKGGSGFLAAQINQARDVLLKGSGR